MISAVVVPGPGAPRVEVTSDRHPVFLVLPGGERRQVRGSLAGTTGVVTVEDWEVPPGVPATWTNGVDEAGPVVVPEAGMLWLVPCDDPTLAAELLVEKNGYGAWARSEKRDQLDIPGGAPHVVTLRSQARSGEIVTLALSREQHESTMGCLTAPGAHFVHASSRVWPMRGITYLDVSGVSDAPVRDRAELWTITFTATQIDRPAVPEVPPSGWDAMGPYTWTSEPTVLPSSWAGMP